MTAAPWLCTRGGLLVLHVYQVGVAALEVRRQRAEVDGQVMNGDATARRMVIKAAGRPVRCQRCARIQRNFAKRNAGVCLSNPTLAAKYVQQTENRGRVVGDRE